MPDRPSACKGGHRAAFFVLLTVAFHGALGHGDDKPKHGGIMGRGDESVSVEFVVANGVVTLYVEDHEMDAPVAAEAVKDARLSVTGAGRAPQQVELKAAGGNRLSASGVDVRVGDRMRVGFVLPDGRESGSLVVFRAAAPRR